VSHGSVKNGDLSVTEYVKQANLIIVLSFRSLNKQNCTATYYSNGKKVPNKLFSFGNTTINQIKLKVRR